ncbi:MAG: hypothetical protein RL264_2420 [Bacteroidota bacterium]|jgi:hypothetical protein
MAKEHKIGHHGSLGALALGHIGLRAWRKAIQEEKERSEKEGTTVKKNGKKTK